MIQRILNGFQIRLGAYFFWLNAYGVGLGVWDDIDHQFIIYRRPQIRLK
jgi:hypothetical protein